MIDLASGVRWEELTATTEDGVDFLLATYEVGGSSTPDNSLIDTTAVSMATWSRGRWASIGFQEYRLEPGDSIAFDSTRPTGSSTSATSRPKQSGSWSAARTTPVSTNSKPQVVGCASGTYSLRMIDRPRGETTVTDSGDHP